MTGTLVATLLSLALMIGAGGIVLRALSPNWHRWGIVFALWATVLFGWTALSAANMVTAGVLRSDRQIVSDAPFVSLLGSTREVRRVMVLEDDSEGDGLRSWLSQVISSR